jgi:hypothetical protein
MYDVRSIDTRTCDTRAPGSCPVIGINSHVVSSYSKDVEVKMGRLPVVISATNSNCWQQSPIT